MFKDVNVSQQNALKEFQKAATQECIDAIADDLYLSNTTYCEPLTTLATLACEFDNSTGEQQKALEYYFGQAIRYRDSELVNLIALEMHTPHSQLSNPRFIHKLKAITERTATPVLKAVN